MRLLLERHGRLAPDSSSVTMPTSIEIAGLHEIRRVRAARPLVRRFGRVPPCSGRTARARSPALRLAGVDAMTTAGTMSPAAIGRDQRSC